MAPVPSPKLIARNVAAVRRFADASSLTQTTAGNPVSTRLESGIGNCFPGLECDLRNLERRFFPFLEVDIGDDQITLVGVDTDGVARAAASGELSQPKAATYSTLANELASGRSVFISRLSGTFGVLGSLDLDSRVSQHRGRLPAIERRSGQETPGRMDRRSAVDRRNRRHAYLRERRRIGNG